MKTIASIVILLSVSSGAAAQESVAQSVTPDRLGAWAPGEGSSCETIYGSGRQLCLADRYRMHQEEQAQDDQAALERAQAENQRLHNELLRRELARIQTAAAAPSTADVAATPGFANWQTENRWFGSDRARTEFALLYAKDLRQEQPGLTGRSFLDALSARVKEVFAAPKR
jgi:hypothetical protein